MTAIPTPNESLPGLENDEEGSRIVTEELRLLAVVKKALEDRRAHASAAEAHRRDDEGRLLELRDEVAVAKPEDLPALFEQMHHLGALRAQRGRGAQGFVDVKAPYFAHLRLVENGKRRDVLIGARSYVDGAAGIRIVDWRHAPVSKIYYRYQEGDDYEEELGDRMVEGNVVARRSIAIHGGELVRVACPQGVFLKHGDAWARAEVHSGKLSARRGDTETAKLGAGGDRKVRIDKHLPEIAALLDAAQFDLITRGGLVVIQGSAGSGKTTVGLHRAAYLAENDPRRFRPERMLVIVPNEALRHYVGRVLPSLGVEGVAIGTFARFARRVVPDLFPRIPYSISDSTPPVVSRAKNHAAMHRAMKAMAARAARAFDSRVEGTIAKWPGADLASAAWKATSEILVPDMRLAAFGQWLAGKRKLANVGEASALPQVTRPALEKVVADNRVGPRAVLTAWDELCTSRERLAQTFEGVAGFGAGQLDQIHSWCVRQARVRSEGERDGETPTLDAEDHAMLLRLWQLLRGPLLSGDGSALRFSHVFIDEVQDASPIELAVLIDLAEPHDPRRAAEKCVTLAGDAAQRLSDEGQDRGELDWNELLDELGVPHVKLEPLKVSYRSTAEITGFARALLGPYAHDAEPIATRHGPPVELFEFTSPGEAVAFLADALRTLAREAPDANVALAARFGPQADVYYEGLLRAEVPNVRRVAKQDFTWEAGFDVTDVRQTKGLEFDEVILLDANASSYPDSAPARHALYVGATRAAHQLWCTTSDETSPVVRRAMQPQ
ncbi:MAG TPA: ATP-binding domain-containing protein [Polyangiaceae bacterium]